jgi:hypothetical protein
MIGGLRFRGGDDSSRTQIPQKTPSTLPPAAKFEKSRQVFMRNQRVLEEVVGEGASRPLPDMPGSICTIPWGCYPVLEDSLRNA